MGLLFFINDNCFSGVESIAILLSVQDCCAVHFINSFVGHVNFLVMFGHALGVSIYSIFMARRKQDFTL
jgi:hypothetical protein